MEDADARRARLRALREAAQAQGDRQDATEGQNQANEGDGQPEKPMLKFRNYNVQDQKRIEHEKVAPAQPPKLQEPIVQKPAQTSEQEEVLVSVAPKKANWDLKRDIQSKLDKLERRTQRAIIEIMQEEERQRLQEEGGVAD